MKSVQTMTTFVILLIGANACSSKSVGIAASGTGGSMWQEAEWVTSSDYPKYDDGGLHIRAHIAHPSFLYATNDGIDSIAIEIMSNELITRASREYLNAIQRTGTVEEMGGHRDIYDDYVRQTNNALIFRQMTYWELGQGSKESGSDSRRYNVWGIYRTTSEEYRRIKLAAWDKLVTELEIEGLALKVSSQKIRSHLEVDPSPDQ